MKEQIRQLAQEKKFSGAFALVRNGVVVDRFSLGYANPALNIPNTPETRFNIGSIGKMLTSVAIAKLVDSGKLAYDKPIKESLAAVPNCPAYHSELFAKLDVTPHELLTHTAGLDDHAGRIYENSLGPAMLSFNRVEEYFQHFASVDEQKMEARSRYRYSNLGYYLLGLAIEAITGNYHEYVAQNVLQPAGMTHTTPNRSPRAEFALSTITEPNLPSEAPRWLVDLSLDEDDLGLSQDAHAAIVFFADVRKLTEARDKLAAEITTDYNQNISTITESEYPAFRAQLLEKLEELNGLIRANHHKSEELAKPILSMCRRLHAQVENPSEVSNDPRLQSVARIDQFLMRTLVHNLFECPQMNMLLNSLSIAHPAGCWYSTVDDLVAFDQSLKDGALSQYRPTLLGRAVSDGSHDSQYGYGCAITRSSSDSLHGLGHNGGVPGGLSSYRHYPNTGYTLVMLSNEDDHSHIFGLAEAVENLMQTSVRSAYQQSSVVKPFSIFTQPQPPQPVSRRTEEDEKEVREYENLGGGERLVAVVPK